MPIPESTPPPDFDEQTPFGVHSRESKRHINASPPAISIVSFSAGRYGRHCDTATVRPSGIVAMVLPHRTWNFNIDRYLNPFVPSVPAMEVRAISASMVSGVS
ncbi:hypothetical protein E4U60_006594 [Claviceps pazoutovae]|uniref:Uncharacterized protein n=1 Tax=Claviceps pazoutovae TaxID=1649127 RepID=A0A9P7MGG4_9HYPO|nr:hypothetical protein E4U60_006594 [Claviceps pazoutovae]